MNTHDPTMLMDPVRHIVIDDAMPAELVRACKATWPRGDWSGWHLYDSEHARKLATTHPSSITRSSAALLNRMAELPVSGWFGETRAFPDLDLHGAGMHELPVNGFLARHRDAEVHPVLPWSRRLSAVLMLDFCKDGEGSLCLGETQIMSRANRLVIFECSEQAWHEVRPTRTRRRSLALFWWSEIAAPKSQMRTRAEFAVFPTRDDR